MLKISIVILAVMLAFAGVYSFLNIFATKVVVSSAFEALTGKTLDGIQDDDYLKAYLWANKYTGIFALCTTIAGFFILFSGFRNKEQWAWWSVLAVGGLAWIWGLVNGLVFGDTFSSIMYIVGTVLLIAGLLASAKIFLVKKSE